MGPIKRANDGLALSSRNAYLTKEQRNQAPSLYRCLQYIKQQINNGVTDIELLLQHQKRELEEKDLKIDYLNLFSFEKMEPIKKIKPERKYILAGAIYVGETRLIDNLIVEKT